MRDNPAIVVIGAGFGGLGMGIRLIGAGFHDFVILEKSGDLGGTWYENTYPGCACDVPSPMYSYSFELNPGWSRMFAPRKEIHEYLRRTAAKYGLTRHIRYHSQVERLEYDDDARRWEVTLADGTRHTPRAVVSGVGALHVPAYPDLPGLGSFTGTTFHSAEWDHSYDLTGKRVAVIGTGASAVQFVPQIAEQVARLHLFQRTPPWIQPKPDIEFGEKEKAALRLVPGAARALRYGIYWALERRGLGFALDPRLSGPLERVARRHIERQIPDPELRRKVTPGYTFGCKRVLLSNDYYPALTRPQVDLVTEGVAEVRERSIVTGDGRELEVDCIIFGTGFKVVDALAEKQIIGRGARKLQDAWADGVRAHRGIMLPGFPNLFMLMGPNTGLGHHSVVFMIEVQIRHILSSLRLLRERGADVIEPRPDAMRRYNRRLRRRLRRAVWNEGGCSSWYLDENGVNRALWPGFTFEYWLSARRARPGEYVLSR